MLSKDCPKYGISVSSVVQLATLEDPLVLL